MKALFTFFLLNLQGADNFIVRDLEDFSNLSKEQLTYAGKSIQVFIVKSMTDERLGLMGVRQWPLTHALAFGASSRSFWMRNVPIPLDMVFLDDNLCVLSTARLQPHSEVSYHVPYGTAWTFEMASHAIEYYGFRSGQCFYYSSTP